MTDTREDSVYLAKLAEQAERYEGECRYEIYDSTTILTHDRFLQRWSRT